MLLGYLYKAKKTSSVTTKNNKNEFFHKIYQKEIYFNLQLKFLSNGQYCRPVKTIRMMGVKSSRFSSLLYGQQFCQKNIP